MKLSALLASRSSILRQAALAHTASSWATLQRAADRIAFVGLRGTVHLRQTPPSGDEAPGITLTTYDVRASVIEEHFTDEDLYAVADALAFATDTEQADLTFTLETLGETYAAPLLRTLEKAGIALDLQAALRTADSPSKAA